jgi:hypothetical protein
MIPAAAAWYRPTALPTFAWLDSKWLPLSPAPTAAAAAALLPAVAAVLAVMSLVKCQFSISRASAPPLSHSCDSA